MVSQGCLAAYHRSLIGQLLVKKKMSRSCIFIHASLQYICCCELTTVCAKYYESWCVQVSLMRLKHLIVTTQFQYEWIVDIVSWKALRPGACLHGSQGKIWLATPDTDPVKTWSPRRPSGQDHGNQMSLLHNLTLLQEQPTGLSGQMRTGLPTEPGFSHVFFSPFCHQWSFVSSPLLPLACLVVDT